jgi:hypothetical protein
VRTSHFLPPLFPFLSLHPLPLLLHYLIMLSLQVTSGRGGGVIGTEVQEQRRQFEETEWGLVPGEPSGTYPRRRDVTSGTRLRFCAVSRRFCLSPSFGNPSRPVLIGLGPSFASQPRTSLDCLRQLPEGDLTCDFGGIQTPVRTLSCLRLHPQESTPALSPLTSQS